MTTPTDKELIALLQSPRPQDKATFKQYLDSVSEETANETLHRIASQVVTHGIRPHHFGWFLCSLLCSLWLFAIVFEVREGKSISNIVGSSVVPVYSLISMMLTFFTHAKVQESNEALLLLAARNDSRALPLLMSEWQLRPSQKLCGWNARVEAEATRLLDENQGGTTSVEWRTMRKVVEQILQSSPTAASRRRKDIAPGQAYFALAILRILNRAGGGENQQLLKKVAALPTDTKNFPNRTFVTEVATVYQDKAATSAFTTTAPMSAVTPTNNTLQTLHHP